MFFFRKGASTAIELRGAVSSFYKPFIVGYMKPMIGDEVIIGFGC